MNDNINNYEVLVGYFYLLTSTSEASLASLHNFFLILKLSL